ncbi:MAG: hypothetical protein IPH16_17340 [Haliscomenobacter sp.]|nr:hypothetical protein [Haliscomenobacter sp.]
MEGRYVKHLKEKAFYKAFEADIDELPTVAIEGGEPCLGISTASWGEDMLNTHIVQTELASVDMQEAKALSKSGFLPES